MKFSSSSDEEMDKESELETGNARIPNLILK